MHSVEMSTKKGRESYEVMRLSRYTHAPHVDLHEGQVGEDGEDKNLKGLPSPRAYTRADTLDYSWQRSFLSRSFILIGRESSIMLCKLSYNRIQEGGRI